VLFRSRDGNWTYQFAVTVDDMEQGVTLVIRGDDLLASTGRQIQLARLLGRAEPPRFLHHSLIMKSATQKLSKADQDTSVRDMREAGQSVADVIGRAMHASGLSASPVPMAREAAEARVAERYDLRSIGPGMVGQITLPG
jgi:glutamyl/glutaminyl-tRNA synthetase